MSDGNWPEYSGTTGCPRSEYKGLMLFVYVQPKERHGDRSNFTPEEFRDEIIRGIQGCEHKPNSHKLPQNPIFRGKNSHTKCNGGFLADTSMTPSKWKDGNSLDNGKNTTTGKTLEYWFPSTSESSVERMQYVKNYWKWFEEMSWMVEVRCESYHHYREGIPDERNYGGKLYEYRRRATHRVEPKYPVF